jgi:tRNA-Thr(GGU) m(6)t(6)A37 methyltransferase TsaA
MEMTVRPIGVVHTTIESKDNAPIQGAFRPELTGTIELYPEYEQGLKDVESFSHIMLLYWFHEAGEVKLVRPTFLDDQPHGVFASRHPCRPNGIGLTVVRLLGREGRMLRVSGIDVLNGTPLLDIKPYIPRFDCFPDASEGWTEGKRARPKPTGRE